MASPKNISKPAVLNLLTLLFIFIFQITLVSPATLASPVAKASIASLEKRYSTANLAGRQGTKSGPATSDYPSDTEIKAAFIPQKGPYVFFSGLPNPANNPDPAKFAKTVDGAVVLIDAFPKSYTERRYNNVERSEEWYQNFLDRISGIWADMAVKEGKAVYFVGKSDAIFRKCSVWNRVELPTLKSSNIKITLVDHTNFKNQKDFLYPGKATRALSAILEARKEPKCKCCPCYLYTLLT